MMSRFSIATRFRFNQRTWQIKALAIWVNICLLLSSSPALAHHLMGGKVPATFLEGFMSGLAHPMIGLDHFAFIVAIGLLSAIKQQGILIPIAFILTAMAGTGFHLTGHTLPGAEFFVAGSILLFGLLLALRNNLNTATLIGLGAIAGLCHGYAYGEAIFGAEVAPLVAYLTGFTVIQLAIILCAFGVGTVLLKRAGQEPATPFRSIGWVICGVGLTFLTSQIMSAIFPGV